MRVSLCKITKRNQHKRDNEGVKKTENDFVHQRVLIPAMDGGKSCGVGSPLIGTEGVTEPAGNF
ncbi:hypothetical protein ED312_14730 [Sinomicrobium pectinilyticum]|uniref:Uncharacterized protein n=1 Tax=Sinomicrobium pectinilyticum TaxID=1084421 RepID=A0A3N0E7A7_SINP1|nr:hypothetical protein ED312_14730 [Sinomicrobium pectinilyticum]